MARLRACPHPYRAMLAVCSDLDETPGFGTYFEIARFLNTTESTSMGPGLGLEVGNTIFFDMAPGEVAYWNASDAEREGLRALMRSGHIDGIHSYGDLASTRSHAGRALDELDRHDLRLRVWIDHAVAPTNFGPDIMQGTGDLPGSPAYHSDLTHAYGIHYVWRGRVTSVTGQDVPRRLGGILDSRHRVASARTLAKEAIKGWIGRLGARKYEMHAPNRLLRPTCLRDGRPVREFLRSNPHWAAVDRGETADGIAEVVTPSMLARLVRRGGLMVLYTHLGKVRDASIPFSPATRAAFERLGGEQQAGRILVTTTRRLLDYARDREEATWECRQLGGELEIDVEAPCGGSGLSFEVAAPDRARLTVNGQPCRSPSRLPARSDSPGVIAVPWPRLEWPLS